MRVFNNPDLYPTPVNVIETMTLGLDLNGKTVLEPSAGLGDIVDFCAGSGASVLACEIVPELREVLNSKDCKIIADDFSKVTKDQVSHIDYIIMNPPFSQDTRHILHAWDIAPEGCTVISLCNFNTLVLDNSHWRKTLHATIKDYGKTTELGNVFSDAERQTNVNVGMVVLKKPITSAGSEFEGFFMDEEEEDQFDGLQQYNFVRDVVNRYVGAVKIFDIQLQAAKDMNNLAGEFSRTKIALQMTEEGAVKSREDYKKELQKDAWKWVIGKFNLSKYSTQGLMEDINKFVEQQTSIPFTMKNIYQMINIIIGTAGNRMDKALEEVFDNFTKHYHENRYGGEGWKTNSHYLLNQKFIVPYIAPLSKWGGMDINYRSAERLDDFTKALCYIMGENYDGFTDPYNSKYKRFTLSTSRRNSQDPVQYGEWFDWGFFEVKLFKKGTGHFKFKDRDVWAAFNQHIARIKGFPLPEAVKKK